jgi:putative transposase
VEVTCRTVHGRFLLKPTMELRSIVIGVLARAQKLYPLEIHAFVFLSNHYHLLLTVEDACQLARFMNHLNSSLAREAGRIHGWKEKFWGRRYQAIVVSEEEAAQVGRLQYLISHGCKEGLVARPRDWPGAQCADALTTGRLLEGLWFNRTAETTARLRREQFHYLKFATRERVRLESLPCWSHLSVSRQQRRVRRLVAQIVKETADRHARNGTQPLGPEFILTQDPLDRPQGLRKTCAPIFHAATKTARRELVEAYRWFVASYRKAAERLRQGNQRASFPEGSFPPRGPFVGWNAEPAPR